MRVIGWTWTSPHSRSFFGSKLNVDAGVHSWFGSIGHAASSDTTARLWELSTGQAIRIYQGHNKAIVCCALHDGTEPSAVWWSDTTIIQEQSSLLDFWKFELYCCNVSLMTECRLSIQAYLMWSWACLSYKNGSQWQSQGIKQLFVKIGITLEGSLN